MVENPVLTIPANFDYNLLHDMSQKRGQHWSRTGLERETDGRIVRRKLVFGVHNGRTMIYRKKVIELEGKMDANDSVRSKVQEFYWDGCVKYPIGCGEVLWIAVEYDLEWRSLYDRTAPPFVHTVCIGQALQLLSDVSKASLGIQLQPKRVQAFHSSFTYKPVALKELLRLTLQVELGDPGMLSPTKATSHRRVSERPQMLSTGSLQKLTCTGKEICFPVSGPFRTLEQPSPRTGLGAIQESSQASSMMTSRSEQGMQSSGPTTVQEIGSPPLSPPGIMSGRQTDLNRTIGSPGAYPPMPTSPPLRKDAPLLYKQPLDLSDRPGPAELAQRSFDMQHGRPATDQPHHGTSQMLIPSPTTQTQLLHSSREFGKGNLSGHLSSMVNLKAELEDERFTTDYTVKVLGLGLTQWRHNTMPVRAAIITTEIFGERFKSERVEVPRSTSDMAAAGEFLSGTFAESVRFQLKPAPILRPEFVNYLYNNSLRVRVWDADSLLLVGIGSCPLRPTLRQGENEIKHSVKLDIVSRKETITSDGVLVGDCNFAGEGLVHARAIVEISHHGAPLPNGQKLDFKKVGQAALSTAQALTKQDASSLQLELHGMSRDLTSKPIPQAETDLHLRSILRPVIQKRLEAAVVMQNLRDRTKSVAKHAGQDGIFLPERGAMSQEELRIRRDNLKKISDARRRKKDALLRSICQQNISQTRTIRPMAGECIFWEIVFKNPFSTEKTFYVSITDPLAERKWIQSAYDREEYKSEELSVVVDDVEAAFHRKRLHMNAPADASQVLRGDKIMMGPGCKAHIPMKFQSFCCGNTSAEGLFPFSERVEPLYLPILQRAIEVRIVERAEDGNAEQTVSHVQVLVEPRSVVTDNTLTFQHCEDSQLQATIELGMREMWNQERESGMTVHCSCDDVAFEFRKEDGRHKLWFQYLVGHHKQPGRFHMFLYGDNYMAELQKVYEIEAIPMLREDIHCLVGQTQVDNLLLGACGSGEARCYSGDPQLVFKDDPVDLDHAHCATEYSVQAASAGTKWIRGNVVSQGTMMASWLLRTVCEFPPVGKTFSVSLAPGGATEKRLPYTNVYNKDRNIAIITSNPNLMQVLTPTMALGPHQASQIALQFTAPDHDTTVHLFINEHGRVMECLRFDLTRARA